jgi:hypothetical protein
LRISNLKSWCNAVTGCNCSNGLNMLTDSSLNLHNLNKIFSNIQQNSYNYIFIYWRIPACARCTWFFPASSSSFRYLFRILRFIDASQLILLQLAVGTLNLLWQKRYCLIKLVLLLHHHQAPIIKYREIIYKILYKLRPLNFRQPKRFDVQLIGSHCFHKLTIVFIYL